MVHAGAALDQGWSGALRGGRELPSCGKPSGPPRPLTPRFSHPSPHPSLRIQTLPVHSQQVLWGRLGLPWLQALGGGLGKGVSSPREGSGQTGEPVVHRLSEGRMHPKMPNREGPIEAGASEGWQRDPEAFLGEEACGWA